MVDIHQLARARNAANSIRFSNDRSEGSGVFQPDGIQDVRDEFYRNSVEVHANITPQLDASVELVCDRLLVDRKAVTVFVNSSSEFQAACYYTGNEECLVRVSSALANLLDETEFQFVVGHEIGHFLLQHTPQGINQKSVEYFVYQRAQEISADRIGAVGCADANIAAQTLIKTTSGLGGKHIRLDVGQFLSQLAKIGDSNHGENVASTHPSMLVRTRALIWFATANIDGAYPQISAPFINKIDKKVAADMARYVDSQALQRIKEAKADVALWLAAAEVASDGRFDAEEQSVFEEVFGHALLTKLKNFFAAMSSASIPDAVQSKLHESESRLEQLAPLDFESTYRDIRDRVAAKFFRAS